MIRSVMTTVLAPAIQGLLAFKEPCEVEVTTDAEYVRQGITQWVIRWKRRHWWKKTRLATRVSRSDSPVGTSTAAPDGALASVARRAVKTEPEGKLNSKEPSQKIWGV